MITQTQTDDIAELVARLEDSIAEHCKPSKKIKQNLNKLWNYLKILDKQQIDVL